MTAAARAVAGWSERLRDISMCAAMEERRPVLTGRGDLDRALWSQIASAGREWNSGLSTRSTPPATTSRSIPTSAGAALAVVLRDSDPDLPHRR